MKTINFEKLKLNELLKEHFFYEEIKDAYIEKLKTLEFFWGETGFSETESIEKHFIENVYTFDPISDKNLIDYYNTSLRSIADFSTYVEKINKMCGDNYNNGEGYGSYYYGCINVGSNANNRAFYPINDFDKSEKSTYIYVDYEKNIIIAGNYYYEILTKLNLYNFINNIDIDVRISEIKEKTIKISEIENDVYKIIDKYKQYYNLRIVGINKGIHDIFSEHYDYSDYLKNNILKIIKNE
jgi:hypothetical protein